MRLLGALALTVSILAGCTIHSVALPPTPNVVAKQRVPGSCELVIVGAFDEERCTETEGLKDLCISNLRTAVDYGVRSAVDAFFVPDSAKYRATFKVVELTHAREGSVLAGRNQSLASVALYMRWQFTLVAADGTQLVADAETTKGPIVFVNVNETDGALKALLTTVADRIGTVMNEAPLSPKPARAASGTPI